ncbi:Rho GTPase [Entamoeba marina]
MADTADYTFKVLIIGEPSVGYLQMRCSAKTGDGINQIFETLAKGIYNNKEIMANLPKKSGITVVDPKKSGSCC